MVSKTNAAFGITPPVNIRAVSRNGFFFQKKRDFESKKNSAPVAFYLACGALPPPPRTPSPNTDKMRSGIIDAAIIEPRDT